MFVLQLFQLHKSRSGGGCGAKINITARIFPMRSDASGQMQQVGQRLQVRYGTGLQVDALLPVAPSAARNPR